MKTSYLTSKQGIILTFLFLSGGSFALGNTFGSIQDSWIAFLLATALALPFVWVYAKLLSLNPDKNIFELFLLVFGSFWGRMISLCYIFFSMFITSMVLFNFGKFSTLDSMQSTPAFVMILILCILCAYGLRKDITTLGRWSELVLPIILFFTLITFVLSLIKGNFTNLLPILSMGISPVIFDALDIFLFSFGQTVLLLGVLSFLNRKASSFQVLTIGLLFSAAVALLIFTKNLIVLGPNLLKVLHYPGFYAANILHFENVFQSLEMLVAANYFFNDFIKITICILFSCLGIATFVKKNSYRKFVIPITVFSYLFTFVFSFGIVSLKDMLPLFRIACIFFEMAIPLLTVILLKTMKKSQFLFHSFDK